jgi:hypothetical protein
LDFGSVDSSDEKGEKAEKKMVQKRSNRLFAVVDVIIDVMRSNFLQLLAIPLLISPVSRRHSTQQLVPPRRPRRGREQNASTIISSKDSAVWQAYDDASLSGIRFEEGVIGL